MLSSAIGNCVSMCGVVLLLAGVWNAPAVALDRGRAVTQHMHRSWTGDQGLPQNSVFSLEQTPDGFLWVGTWEGLARFDGAAFTVFDRRNTPGFKLNGVLSLAVDGSGALWIGTEDGLLWRRGDAIERVAEPRLEGARIAALLSARDGTLWIGTDRGLLQRQGEALVEVALPGGRNQTPPFVAALAEDRSGAVWAATGRAVYRLTGGVYDGGAPVLEGQGLVVAPAQDGGVWLGRARPTPMLAHHDGTKLQPLPKAPPGEVLAIREVRHQRLWIASTAGAFRWDGSTLTPLPALAGVEVLSLFQSADRGLWIGTAAAGLHRLSDTPMRVFGVPEGLTSDQTFPILEDSTGAVWIGTHNGLNRLRDGKVERFQAAQGVEAEHVRTLSEGAAGELFIGAANGVFHFDGERFSRLPGMESRMVFALLYVDGTLWIATPEGLVEHRDGEVVRTIDADAGLPRGQVHALLQDRQLQLWAGGASGLFQITDAGARRVWPEGDAREAVLDIHEGPGGELWFGTLHGLGVRRNGQVSLLTAANGLYDDAVFRILEDGEGNFWMSCNRGLFRMSRAELLAVADGARTTATADVFGRSSGMRSAECNGTAQPSGMRARDGSLWFPTLKGAVTFDPANPNLRRVPPTPVIEGIFFGGQRLSPASLGALPPEVRTLDLHFNAPAFDDGDRLRFRHRLVGHDPDWVESSSRRVAHYSRLRPGRYLFEVEVALPGAPAQTARTEVAFRLEPRWTESVWFYLGAAAAVLGLIGGAFALRIRRMKAHERELAARVSERTAALAAANENLDDQMRALRATQAQLVEAGKLAAVGTLAAGVGHEINNPLAYIVSNLRFVREEVGALAHARSTEQRDQTIAEIGQALEECLQGTDRVRRIVQDLKTFSRRDDEERLAATDVHAILESAVKLAGGELRHRAQVVRAFGGIPRVRANGARLGQVFLNLLVNAAHALPEGRALENEVRLVTRREGAQVVVEVIDTGTGISAEVLARIFEPFFTTKPVGVGTGLGLALCRTYLQAMGGSIEVESADGRGSTFRARLPVAEEGEDGERPPLERDRIPASERGRILIIDDDPLVIAALERVLRDEHEVVGITSARLGLSRLMNESFDLVLCDLMMPQMTGMELHAELLRTAPALARSVVFITGGAFTEHSRAFLTSVENRRLEKPFELDEVRTLVANRVSRQVRAA